MKLDRALVAAAGGILKRRSSSITTIDFIQYSGKLELWLEYSGNE